jgi:PEP-CTERM motif-containing protein
MKTAMCVVMALVFVTGTAMGGVVFSDSDSVPVQSTNFDEAPDVTSVTLSKYLGAATITKVVITLDASVEGTIKFENEDAVEADVVAKLQAVVDVDGGLLSATPAVDKSELDVAAYDGTTDFLGVSGRTHASLSGSDSDSVTLTGGAMAPYLGAGTVTFDVDALGTSFASGPGNISSQFITDAGAVVTIEYYSEEGGVPEPGAMALMGLGLAGLARRKRS